MPGLMLYHLCGGGSATNYRGLPDSVVQNNSYKPIVDDLINVRGPLMDQIGQPKSVMFGNPGGLEETSKQMHLEQLFNVKNEIARSYLEQIKRLFDNGWLVNTYLGYPTKTHARYYQDCLLPLLELHKNSSVSIDGAATTYSPVQFREYVKFLATMYPFRVMVEGEPTSEWDRTPVVLATGNQPYNWSRWLKDHKSDVYAILQGNTVSDWPTPSVSQACSMQLLGYVPVLDFWLLDKDTVQQW